MRNENADDFNDKAIMVHAMMLACYIDGKMAPQELATVESYAKSLPEYYGRDFQEYYQAAKEIAARVDGDLQQAVDCISEISSSTLRVKTLYCCLELALCDGSTESEEKFLAEVQGTLGISPDLADDMRRIISIKFAEHHR
jgi:tellurite resistance protein